jgi:hypothetical protein
MNKTGKHLPFSAPRRRSLPTVNAHDIEASLQGWKNKLQRAVKNSLPAPPPYNFAVTSVRGGLKLTWSPVQTPADTSLGSPDGYEILKSPSGTFTDDIQVIPIKAAGVFSYLDSIDGSAKRVSYRIRTTAGTPSRPQSVRGPESGVVAHRSIDASDTKSTPTTVVDNFTTSKTRAAARFGNYGPESAYRTSLGEVGGSSRIPSGLVVGGNPSSDSQESSSPAAVTFDQIQSGENLSAQMIVGGGASIDVDPSDPGIIDATNLQTTPVSPVPPILGQILILDSTGALSPFTPPATVRVGGLPVSNDYVVGVNGISYSDAQVLAINVNKPISPQRNVAIFVNSWPVSDDYQVSVNVPKQIFVNGV